MENIEVTTPDGRTLECGVIRSKRAAHIRMRITPDANLEFVMPCGLDSALAGQFALRHMDWILKNLAAVAARPAQNAKRRPESLPLAFLGHKFKITYEYKRAAWCGLKCDFENDTLNISGNIFDDGLFYESIGEFLKRAASKYITPFLLETAQSASFAMPHVSYRIQKRRWGSCSQRGTLSINALLLFMREECVRYVLIHELCHTLEMNHSERFWNHVAKFCPNYGKLKLEIEKTALTIPDGLLKL